MLVAETHVGLIEVLAKNPNGQLARQTTRVYDALNRQQQITGGMQ